ncbi:MAG: hypothetical protein HQL31_07625 [Planctomycetes bacterium]|nr:hypothetical protein [Planctomycetota bacterium]
MAGYTIKTAANGKGGLAKARSFIPELIMLDIKDGDFLPVDEFVGKPVKPKYLIQMETRLLAPGNKKIIFSPIGAPAVR